MAENISSAGGRLCLDDTSNSDHAAGLLKIKFNDPTERSFGPMTAQLKYYGKIVLNSAGGVSQVKVNGNFLSGFDTGCPKKKNKGVERIFYKLLEEMRVSLEKM